MTLESQNQINRNKVEYPKNIQLILDKIKNDTSDTIRDLLSQDDFVSIFMYLSESYIWYWEIPEEIKVILNNKSFIKYINDYIKTNINNILSNDWIYSFEEISFCFFLLSFWKFNWILIDLNTYNIELLSELVDHVIENILNKNIPQESQENYYDSFLNLTDLVNTLCILNEIDSLRKNLIPKFTKLLTEKVINLKRKLQNQNRLTKQKEDELDYLIARFWINFSHISYISIKDKILDEIILWFSEIIKNQINSYNEAIRTNFWWNPHKINFMQWVFLWNVSYTILVMINKIKEWYEQNNLVFNEEKVLDNAYLQDLVSSIFSYIPWMKEFRVELTIKKLELICNNVFWNIYFDENYQNILEEWYAKKAIYDFMSNTNSASWAQIESVHHLIMFLPELDEKELLKFWNFLLWLPKYNNYNFEFFKLKTFDLIVSKLSPIDINTKDTELSNLNLEIKNFLKNLTNYIEKNKVASQLLHTYSRLYLSIAYFYAFCSWEEFQELSLEHFSIFSKMNWDSFEYEKYWKDLDIYYYKIWAHKLFSTLCDCENAWNCWIIKNCNFTKEQVIKFWEKKVSDYKKSHEPILRNAIDDLLQKLLDDALSQNWLSDDEINRKISEILSNKVFHWIAETFIFEFNHNENDKKEDVKNIIKKKLKLHNWIDCHIVDLFNWYKLVFSYPKIYETTFKEVFEQENSYIIINIKNIITWYLKKRDSFLDHWTWLPNEAKLKTVLLNTKKPISFINIKLSTIKNINNGYSYELWDEYMAKVWQSLSNIPELTWNIFRLSWAKFWIIIEDENKIDEIIKKIKDIKIKIAEIEFKLDFFLWIVVNENKRIVEKSSSALALARKKWTQYAFYSDEINDLSQNKQDLEYLAKLDKAIEEDRVIPFFQPIIDTKTWKIVKYEALMRIQLDNWEFESPALYLDAAKKFWRLNNLAYIIIDKVFSYASKYEGNFSINLSWDDLWNEDILVFIWEKLKYYEINSKRITFEILEWEWTEDNQNISWVIKLKDMWFRIAMDDFWANNSNINRLIDFLSSWIIDDLKIDGKMIRSLEWENKKLKQEFEELFELLMQRLKTDSEIDFENIDDFKSRKEFLDLLALKEQISKKTKLLVSRYLYLKSHIDNLILINSQDALYEEKEKISNLIDSEIKKFASATKKMLSWIVDASHDSWVKVIAEFVESEKIKLICEILWIDWLQWYYIWKPWQFTK